MIAGCKIDKWLLRKRESSGKKHYNILLTTKDHVTVEDLKSSYKGARERVAMFLEVFKRFSQAQLERKESHEITESRYKKFPVLFHDCAAFIKYKYKRSDLPMKDLRLSFVNEFYHYLRSSNGLIQQWRR